MTDVPEADLTDADLDSEIQLLAELIVTASEAAGALDQRTLDILLGVRPPGHAAAEGDIDAG